MGLLEILMLTAGGGLVWYMNYYGKKATFEEARREASHIRTIESVDYELGKLDDELKRIGILSKENRAFMFALHSRRIELQRSAAKSAN